MNFNMVCLGGNLVRDVEISYTQNQTAIANFGMAVNRTWVDQSGQKKEEVLFVDLSAFGKTAENIGKFFKKGMPIFIQGRLKLDTWEDRESSQKRSKIKVIVDTFQFVERKRDEGGPDDEAPRQQRPAQRPAQGQTRQPPAPQARQPHPADDTPPIADDEIPF